jgi:hypothetical protein
MNLGVVVFERRGDDLHFIAARFVCDEQQIRGCDPDADVPLIQAFCRDIDEKLQDAGEAEEFLRTMESSFSNSIEFSARMALITTDPGAEVDELVRLYLKPASREQ